MRLLLELGQLAGASLSQFADVVQKDRLLRGVEVRGVLRDLREERIGQQHRGLVLVASRRVAQQGGDIHLQRLGQTVQRAQRRHRLAVLDLGDVGTWHAHTGGELPLREVAHVTQVAHSAGYLETAFFLRRRATLGHQGNRWNRLGLFREYRLLATPAHIGHRAILRQRAVYALKYLTLIDDMSLDRCSADGRHHGCHIVCCGRLPERGAVRLTSDKR